MSQKTTLYFSIPSEAAPREEQISKGRICRAKEFSGQFAPLGATTTLVGECAFSDEPCQRLKTELAYMMISLQSIQLRNSI